MGNLEAATHQLTARAGRTRPDTGRRLGSVGRCAVVGALLLGGGAFAGSLAPAAGAEPTEPVSEAAGSAMTVTVAGKSAGTGEFRARHDGIEETTTGTNSPPMPLGGGRDAVMLGGLAQDATAAAGGTSAACAGLIGADGILQIGPDASCLVDNTGRVRLSLGTLEDLSLVDLPLPVPLPDLPELPELPEFPAALPPMELVLEAESITGQCVADPEETSGSATVLDGRIVAVLGDRTIPLLELPATGTADASLGTTLADLLEQLGAVIPGLDAVLDQIPREDLPTDQLIRVVTNEQVKDRDRTIITVTALHVEVVPNNLADVHIGKATCGPNRTLHIARPTPSPEPTATPTEAPPATPQPTPTGVPAGLATAPTGTDRGADAGPLLVFAAAALLLGAYLYRRRTGT